MKKTIAKGIALAFICSLFATESAMALSITGGLSLAGQWTPVDETYSQANVENATGIDFGNAFVIDANGSFASEGLGFLSPATMTDFQFSPSLSPSPVDPLWEAGIFEFVMESVRIDEQTNDTLILTGLGTISATGYDDTLSTWLFTGNTSQGTFSWSSSSGPAPVPEPATMLLFGSGLAGLAGLARKRQKA